jgi:hypothetical protein
VKSGEQISSTAPRTRAVTWSQLPASARAFRVAHALWAMVSMGSLGYIWACAITGRRDRILAASAAWLGLEGAALVVGRGNCPFGPLQSQLGDPVPLFELVLPPRAAKAAIPALAAVTVAGLVIVAVRRPRRTV